MSRLPARWSLLAGLLLLLGALTACTQESPSHTSTATAFSRPLELTLRGVAQNEAEKAAHTAIEDLLFIAEVSHPWNPGPLGRTNQLFSFGAEFSANPSILPMIRLAGRLEQQTAGYYAPALGRLQQLWGFHSEFPQPMVPSREEIDTLLAARPRMSEIQIDGIRMRSGNSALQIDFGPFAQGYALDTARARLAEQGVTSARIDNGNAVAVLGEDWKLELPGQAAGPLSLHDGEAAVTLSTADVTFADEEGRYHPYIDPYTGYPSRGMDSVTVLHPSAATAAALAQALLAGGETKLASQLQVLSIDYASIITEDGRTVTTPALARRLGSVRAE
ncbi:MAG: FAD:protein FMN transferase [Gammaproteobacteria bacterium]|nr:FAD:protein FMN transferase [Gammaproteobacteria bacterium]MCW8839604.1 FAD:protein FMN transferase [Gammaproteobacteria bacterium]MCW8928216.1 FAD:protein FMN transferase [Gammaproteobacteria bacterium]MCW8957458.1 FAD:protein FMN transferase [Gammaproteobacteria bacterium]MCW8973305.1 FAD:protein FMN transferase [Gammaproteobacteria bacterium]